MGIYQKVVDVFVAEAARAPLGDVITIGQQLVHDCLDVHGKSYRDAQQLFSILGAKSFHVLDVSPYEGADLLHDLNMPLPDSLANCADFIYDGSCLDNIFDTANAMRCFSKMLRPNGRIVILEVGAAFGGAYVALSPEWFFNFFAANDYERCTIALIKIAKASQGKLEMTDVYPWYCFDDEIGKFLSSTVTHKIPDIGNFQTCVVAQKGTKSTDDVMPIQAAYRVQHKNPDHDRYMQAHRRFVVNK